MASNLNYIAPQVTESIPLWKTITDISDGYVGITRKPKTYLHMENGETEDSYKARLRKATWIDAFNDTIDGLNGLVFKKPIVYNDDIPSQLQPMIENADMQGNHLDIVIQNFFDLSLRKGIDFILVDMPKSKDVKNKADEKKQGIRTYLTGIKCENVTSWQTDTINGQIILTQVKIREYTEIPDPDNEYAVKTIEQYRILTRGAYVVLRPSSEANKDDILIDSGTTGLDFIPLVALNLQSEGFFTARPPFYDLAQLNIGHYQIFTDSRHSAHLSSVPMLKFLGFNDEEVKKVTISANRAIKSQNENAIVEWLDYNGGGVEVNMNLLNKIEVAMAQMGMSVISGEKELTATEVLLDNTKSQSKLNGYVRALKDAIELVLLYCAKFYGLNDGGTVTIDADILRMPLSADDIRVYSDMIAKGQLTNKTLWLMMKADKKLPEDFDAKVEKENLATEGLLTNPNQDE